MAKRLRHRQLVEQPLPRRVHAFYEVWIALAAHSPTQRFIREYIFFFQIDNRLQYDLELRERSISPTVCPIALFEMEQGFPPVALFEVLVGRYSGLGASQIVQSPDVLLCGLRFIAKPKLHSRS